MPQAVRVIGDELAAPGDSDGAGHVVRLVEVPRGRVTDQRHGRGDPITPPNRPGHDTHEFYGADRDV